MRKALVKWGGGFMFIGMLLLSCATTSSTTSMEETTTAPPTAATGALQPAPEADQEARRQYEIERNRFIYEDVFFARNKYRLDDQARALLSWKAAWLQAHPGVTVVIEGHCSEGGRAEDNMALGLRRAGEVKGFLLRQGVARERLTAVSYGRERPLVEGESEEAQAKNRRVRLTIVE